MESNASRRAANRHDLRRLAGTKPLPSDEAEDLAIPLGQSTKRRSNRLLFIMDPCLVRARLSRNLKPKPFSEAHPPRPRPVLVGENPMGDTEEPKSSLLPGRNLIESPPRDQEHLRHRIGRVFRFLGPPKRVREDRPRVLAKQLLETLHTLGDRARFGVLEVPPSLEKAHHQDMSG